MSVLTSDVSVIILMFSFITTYVCFALIVLQTLIIRCFYLISSGLPAAVEIFLQPLQQFVVLDDQTASD